MKNISSFLKIIYKSNKKLLVMLFVNIILNAVMPFPGIILSKVVFDALTKQVLLKEFVRILVIILLIRVVIQYAYYWTDVFTEIWGQSLMFDLNCQFNKKTLKLDYESFVNPSILEKRELALKVISGSNFIDFIRNTKKIISNVIVVLGVIFMVMQIGLYVVIPVMLVVAINTISSARAKKVQYQLSVEVVPYNRKINYLQQICSDFSNVKEIRINDCYHLIDKKYDSLVKNAFQFIKKIITKQQQAFRLGTITNGVQDFIVYVILGYKILVEKTISLGDFSMYYNAIGQFKNSINEILTASVDMKMNSMYIGHFIEYMEMPEEKIGGAQIDMKNDFTIEFDHVYFKYPGEENYVLEDVTCQLNGKDKILVVGQNGAGKTTFIHLLLRLYRPTKGRILYNGKDINDYDYNEYLNLFSSVFQDYKTFAFSCRENITLGKEEKMNQNPEEIMKRVGLAEKLDTLSDGMETIVSKLYDEKGTEFSGGEKQKLAIARALYKNSKIVIMDEPTSALDPLAEYDIYCKFNMLTDNRMSIFISHRLASSKFCNRILVFHHHKLVEDGTHQELLRQDGIYAQMYQCQSHLYMETENESTIAK